MERKVKPINLVGSPEPIPEPPQIILESVETQSTSATEDTIINDAGYSDKSDKRNEATDCDNSVSNTVVLEREGNIDRIKDMDDQAQTKENEDKLKGKPKRRKRPSNEKVAWITAPTKKHKEAKMDENATGKEKDSFGFFLSIPFSVQVSREISFNN